MTTEPRWQPPADPTETTASPQLSTWSPLELRCVWLPIVALTVVLGIAAIVVAVCLG